MVRLFRCLVVLAALITTALARADEPVDLLLVLATDVSRSVDAQKFQLQREGYAAVIADPRVLNAVQSGLNGRIAVTFVEWSGLGSQKIVIDWMGIDGPKTAQAFGDRLLESPRLFADRTSISGGIEFAVAQFAKAPFVARRRTIDVSGDGTNNSGRDVTAARDETLALGITINGPVFSANARCRGIPSTPIRPAALPIIIVIMSSAAPGPLSLRRRISIHSARPSSPS